MSVFRLSRIVLRNPAPVFGWIRNARAQSTTVNTLALKDLPEQLRQLWPGATFNVQKLTEILDHDNLQMRKDFREFVSDPVMTPKYNISLEEVMFYFNFIFILDLKIFSSFYRYLSACTI